MEFRVAVGESDFASLRESKSYYVDKTEILYDLVHETNNKVSLFTRPRRFGKTLMMSMIENFFNIAKDSKNLFAGLSVSHHTDFCSEWMNKYPVLFVSLKDVEAESFEGAYAMLKYKISELCINLTSAIDKKNLNEENKKMFEVLESRNGSDDDIKSSLKFLMRLLHSAYGKKVILLIDEYDVPIAKANERNSPENNFYRKMLDVIRGIMSTSLKDNEYLQFAVITGCLRIAKESIFTGTNNFASYSVLDSKFSSYFGFTESEVNKMLAVADRNDRAATVKEWYNGYVFGKTHVYCPWDVINYLSALKSDRDARPKNYWKNTSHNGILLNFVKRTDFKVRGKFEILMNGGTIVQTISDELTYDTLTATEDNLWSVLLMTGYITKVNAEDEDNPVSLRIPNREIATIFEDTVVTLFKETVDNDRRKAMMNSFWSGEEKEAEKAISELLWKTISYNDYHEDYYHAFLAGLFAGIGYEVESKKEKGLGRPYILLKDDDNRRALIIEAKKSKSEADMEKDCDKAIEQIVAKKYNEGLYGYRQIFCYGIAFFQKEAKVRLYRK